MSENTTGVEFQSENGKEEQIQMEVFTDSITMNGITGTHVEDRNGMIFFYKSCFLQLPACTKSAFFERFFL